MNFQFKGNFLDFVIAHLNCLSGGYKFFIRGSAECLFFKMSRYSSHWRIAFAIKVSQVTTKIFSRDNCSIRFCIIAESSLESATT